MALKKSYLYFIIDYPGEVNLDYVRNTGAILILRKPENSSLNELEKFQTECLRRGISLYIGNSIKLLFQLKTNKFYISAYNKKQFNHLKRINTKIDIIGSAHNICEINEKIRQGCRNILLSRLFKTNYKNKKGWLGTIKFNLLTRKVSTNFVALGGINEKNFNRLKILNITGLAMSNDKKKAGNYLPAFYKN
jgi:thiamine-phosphate pyrophosphorylase